MKYNYLAKSLLSPLDKYEVDIGKKKRIEEGYSQKELAYLPEKSIGFIGDIENPNYRAKYNLNHINQLAKVFDYSPKESLRPAV